MRSGLFGKCWPAESHARLQSRIIMENKRIVRINDIIDKILAYHPEADVDLLQKAYVYSAKVHHGQTRLSGEPYLNHPLGVAYILTELNLDEYAVSTGLLHDTVEDTYATLEEIERIFGKEVAFLVDGVTKISKLSINEKIDRQAENFRKMILAMSMDIRVILIKLADRANNMRTLQYVAPAKQKRIAQQTLEIYAPLANRLGLFSLKRELEDLSLCYLHENIYKDIESQLVVTAEQREKYVREVISILEEKTSQFGIKATVTGRPKHIYSIYNKMLSQNLNFTQIYDITAFRVVVESRKECYEVLGIIHSIWKPIPGRLKDYISLPKANMYQSLHTTVMGPYGQRIEIQIRSQEMDRVAKQGIAAHWKYKEGRKIQQKDDERFAWLQQVMEAQTESGDSRELLEAFRVDIFSDEVYVFTPAGEVFALPQGSTPVDFAYRVHTDVGNRCVGAKVNGNITPLKHQLQSGDVVEILTQPNQHPSRDWLKMVQTSRAKGKIRQWVKQQERDRSISLGREICQKEFKKNKLSMTRITRDSELFDAAVFKGVECAEDLFAAVGQGRISVRQILNFFQPGREAEAEGKKKEAAPHVPRKTGRGIRIQGMDDIMVRFGKCCNPIPGDSIRGFITRGKGVTVHTYNCPFLEKADPERLIDTQWDMNTRHVANVPVEVLCEDAQGILAEITSTIASIETNIGNAKITTTPDRKAICLFQLSINSLEQLEKLVQALRKIRGVLKVTRVRN
jgi:GTP diphosphokinase / guanosine-3',5'-bis(diphosphate) 3'-diphosphatase